MFKRIFSIVNLILPFTLLFIFNSCNINEPDVFEEIEYKEVSLNCVSPLFIEEGFKIVINSKEKYDSLLYEKHQKKIDEYYERILNSVIEENPGLSNEQHQAMALNIYQKSYMYQWMGTCEPSEFNFLENTLIGVNVRTDACQEVKYVIESKKITSKKIYQFNIGIISSGNCNLICKEKVFWLLIPKTDPSYQININTVYVYNP
ncbi:MAG: hypothetical protein Q8N03_08885 [Ignavibacteria bacterium]|nr:hypothetical protein [Ignavibacteria bacterium]